MVVFIFVSESSYMALSMYMVMGGGGGGSQQKSGVCHKFSSKLKGWVT